MDFEHLVARVPQVLLIPHAHVDALAGRVERKNRGAADRYFPATGNCLIGNLNTLFLPAILRLFSFAFNDMPAGRDCNISIGVSIGPVFLPATISSQTLTDIASYQAQRDFRRRCR